MMAGKEYIERGARLREIDKAFEEYGQNGDILKLFSECRASILFAPTADVVEVRHGEWIIETPNNRKFITCSACRSVIDCLYTNIDENEFDYCPYCGAKMGGKGEGE